MDYITKLLGLQEAKIENIEENNEKIVISLVMQRKKHRCPCCGAETDRVHDYRTQLVNDLDLQNRLNDEEAEILEKLTESMNEMCGIGKRDAFVRGFTLGVRIIMEVLNEESAN